MAAEHIQTYLHLPYFKGNVSFTMAREFHPRGFFKSLILKKTRGNFLKKIETLWVHG